MVFFKCRDVVDPLVTEQRPKPFEPFTAGCQQAPVVVAHLVSQMSKNGPKRLVEAATQFLASDVVGFGEVQCDHTVEMTGDPYLSGQVDEVEYQVRLPVTRVRVDGKSEFVQLVDEATLRRLSRRPRFDSHRVGLVWAAACELTGSAPVAAVHSRHHPVAAPCGIEASALHRRRPPDRVQRRLDWLDRADSLSFRHVAEVDPATRAPERIEGNQTVTESAEESPHQPSSRSDRFRRFGAACPAAQVPGLKGIAQTTVTDSHTLRRTARGGVGARARSFSDRPRSTVTESATCPSSRRDRQVSGAHVSAPAAGGLGISHEHDPPGRGSNDDLNWYRRHERNGSAVILPK